MPKHIGPVDPTHPVEVTIAGLSDHIVAYALWRRDAGTTEWIAAGHGNTTDPVADTHAVLLAPGAQLYYWLGVMNPRRSYAPFHVRLTLSQRDEPVPDGRIDVTGLTNISGNGSVEEWVDVR